MNIELEYRVKSVTRYIVTRYENVDANATDGRGSTGSVMVRGEFKNQETAHATAYALCKLEHEIKGWPVDDPRVRYPETQNAAVGVSL